MDKNYIPSEDSLALGRQIKSLRALEGMTQFDLSEAYSRVNPDGKPLRQATIASIECGRYNTSARTLRYILAAMGYEMKFVKKPTPSNSL